MEELERMPYYLFHTLYDRCVKWNMSGAKEKDQLKDMMEEVADQVQ